MSPKKGRQELIDTSKVGLRGEMEKLTEKL